MKGLYELTNVLDNVPSPTPYGFVFPQIGGSQHPPKTSIDIISGTGKAMDVKFGRYIRRVRYEQKLMKHLREKGAWAYPGTAQSFKVPPIISGTGN